MGGESISFKIISDIFLGCCARNTIKVKSRPLAGTASFYLDFLSFKVIFPFIFEGKDNAVIEPIEFKLNGKPIHLKVDSSRPLLWVLRVDLGVTGPKFGCGEGLCGACTVVVDDEKTLACQTTVGEVKGAELITIEGLAQNGHLHPLQKAFIQHNALQCGFCTPGMILTAYSLLKDNPNPSKDDIIEGMDDNLCRCGAHKRIIKAVETATQVLGEG